MLAAWAFALYVVSNPMGGYPHRLGEVVMPDEVSCLRAREVVAALPAGIGPGAMWPGSCGMRTGLRPPQEFFIYQPGARSAVPR